MTGGVEFTYDQEGRMVGSGHRGASFALIGEGPYAKVYRGRGPTGEFALKVQAERAPVPNVEAEKRFLREYETLVEHGGDDPGLPGLMPVPGFEGDDAPPRFEPLFLCREKGIHFHLPCPRCMRVHTLADCRDDAVLAKAGLPAFSMAIDRYVWCTACGREDPVFYARRALSGSRLVLDLEALVTSLRSTVDRGLDEDPIPSELMVGLNEEFPCITCDQRASCFPREAGKRGLAEVRLIPISMNDFYAYPLPLCPLHFDEAADLLSGAGPSELMKRYGKAWASPPVRQMKSEAIEKGSAPDPATALAGKVDLLKRAIQSALRLHIATGWPHLAISPRHVLVKPRDTGAPLVQLVAPQGPLPLKELRQPPPEPVTSYTAPALHSEEFGKALPVRVHIQKVWSGKGDTFFAAELRGVNLPEDNLDEDDLIRITFDDTGWQGVRIWGNRLPGGLGSSFAGAVSVVTTPETLDITQVNDLKSAKGQGPLFGKASFFRDYGVPFDVHSLGMLLFRALLVNEVQTWETVQDEVVAPIKASLELLTANRPDASPEECRQVVVQDLEREPIDRLTARANVWHQPDAAHGTGISEAAWIDLISLGFKAVTRIEGYSFCPSDREAPDSDATAPARAMLKELEEISERLYAEDAEEFLDLEPPTSEGLEQIPAAVSGVLQEEIDRLRAELDSVQRSRVALERAWEQIFKGVVGRDDPIGPPRDPEDARIPILSATVVETIECVLQVFKGIARFGGDELGEDVPKIRVMIQDALHATEGVNFDPEPKMRRIRRQLKALQMFLFGTVKVFLEAHAFATKQGTASLLGSMGEKLFETEGKKGKLPHSEEIRRRFARMAESLPARHSRIFQPFFQDFVRKQLKKLN